MKSNNEWLLLYPILEKLEKRIAELEKRPTLEDIEKNFKRRGLLNYGPFGMEIK